MKKESEMLVYSLFPTAVTMSRIDVDPEMTSFSLLQKMKENYGNDTSVNSKILEEDIFAKTKELILEEIASYVKNIYKPKNDVEVYITQSWLNITKPGGFHHMHNHTNSFLSGVLYLQAGRNYDGISFYDPMDDQIVLATEAYTPFNGAGYRIHVGTGDLVIFPSWLWHSVDKIGSDRSDLRISIAFNTFVRGKISDEESMTGLTI